MPRPPHAFSRPAPRRLRLVQALAFLWLLGGLLWFCNPVQVSPADSERVFFMPEVEYTEMQEPLFALGVEESCRKPAALKLSAADLLFHEVDQALPLPWQISRVLTQAAPAPGPQHILPEAGQQPLLRPPAALG